MEANSDDRELGKHEEDAVSYVYSSNPACLPTRSLEDGKRAPLDNVGRNVLILVAFLLLAGYICQPMAAILNPILKHGSSSENGNNSNLFSSSHQSLLSGRCTETTYVSGSDYHLNVEVVVAKLIQNVDIGVDIWEEASDAYDNDYTVYGVAGCKHLMELLCKQCLTSIFVNLEEWCPRHAVAAEITTMECFLRYDKTYINVKDYTHENGTPYKMAEEWAS